MAVTLGLRRGQASTAMTGLLLAQRAPLGPGYFAARNSGMTGASTRQQGVELAGAVEGVELVAAADVGVADPDLGHGG